MELLSLKQDESNPLKWCAKFKAPGGGQARKFYVTGVATREEALQSLQASEAEIVAHGVLVEPAPVKEFAMPVEDTRVETTKPGRLERVKHWLIYG